MTDMTTRRYWRGAVAAVAAFATALATAGVAVAKAVPDRGPTAGGTTVSITLPSPIAGLAAGASHSLALGADGRAYAWGYNTSGQLGDGTTTDRVTPGPVARPSGAGATFAFTALSAGLFYSLALGSDGRAYAWGNNGFGQLGDGTTTDRSAPVAVTMPVGVGPGFAFTAISAGAVFSLALGNDGRTYAWGNNTFGQLGDGTTTNRPTPVTVAMPVGVGPGFAFTALAAADAFSLALGNDGHVYAWGNNVSGQLGDGTTTNRATPAAVTTPNGTAAGFAFTAVRPGVTHSLGLGNDSRVYAWGGNDQGQLGDGTTDVRYVPVPVVANALPVLSVQTVLFGAKAGKAINQVSARVFTVRTPQHKAGQVKVTVYWTAGGVAQDPLVVRGGFDYGALASAKPTIKGKAAVGKTVKVKPKKSQWTKGSSLAFQWKANGTKISGATGKKLTITRGLQGKKITVTVTGTKKGYHATARTSKPVTVTK